jgi:ABC-type nitrate/sulfonate/bicarbonate transport system substrate-binding protein
MFRVLFWFVSLLSQVILPANGCAAEKLVGINSALALSQSFPWIAKETGLFHKHNLNFEPVFIQSSAAVTAAMLGGEAEIGILEPSASCALRSKGQPTSFSSAP